MTNENENYSILPFLTILGILIGLLIPLLMAAGIKDPIVIFIALVWILNMGKTRKF